LGGGSTQDQPASHRGGNQKVREGVTEMFVPEDVATEHYFSLNRLPVKLLFVLFYPLYNSALATK
jgi:hypothetical protein